MKAGDVIDGKYELTRMLGQGGMGTVFEARHLLLERRVALKFLRQELAQNKAMSERFLREAKAAASIRSEHIVEVVDVGETGEGEPFMVMEFLEGKELSTLLSERGPFAPNRAANVVIQLCHALAAAHAQGIIHRDIKPENVIVEQRYDGSERVKVLDFGLVKFKETVEGQTANLTATGATMGTPYYMAPEQALGQKDLDHRVDVYSSGVVLFQILTGALPFDGETYAEILVKAATKEPVLPRAVRPDLQPELEALVLRAIARERDQRFQTAQELAQALAPFSGAREIAATVAAMPPPTQVFASTPASLAAVQGGGAQGVAPAGAPGAPGATGGQPTAAGSPSAPSAPQQVPGGAVLGSDPYQSALQMGGVAPGSNPYQSAPQMGGVAPGSNPYQSAPQLQLPPKGPRIGLYIGIGLAVVLLTGAASAGVWIVMNQGDGEQLAAAGGAEVPMLPDPPDSPELPPPPQTAPAVAMVNPTPVTPDASLSPEAPGGASESADDDETTEPAEDAPDPDDQVTPRSSRSSPSARRGARNEPEPEPSPSTPTSPPPRPEPSPSTPTSPSPGPEPSPSTPTSPPPRSEPSPSTPTSPPPRPEPSPCRPLRRHVAIAARGTSTAAGSSTPTAERVAAGGQRRQSKQRRAAGATARRGAGEEAGVGGLSRGSPPRASW